MQEPDAEPPTDISIMSASAKIKKKINHKLVTHINVSKIKLSYMLEPSNASVVHVLKENA